MKNKILITIFCLLIIHTNAQKKYSNLNDYLDYHFNKSLYRNPEFAANLGYKYNYNQLNNYSNKNQEKELKIMKTVLDSANILFPKEKLNKNDLLTLEILNYNHSLNEESQKWTNHYYQITQMGGIVTDFPSFMLNVHSIDSIKDAYNYIERLQCFENVTLQTLDNLDSSISKKVIPPFFTYQYVKNNITEMKIQFKDSLKNPFYLDFKSKIEKLKLEEKLKSKLLSKLQIITEFTVIPNYELIEKKWDKIFENQKQSNGVWALQNGNEYYKYCIKSNTTTDMTPEQIFELGKKEVKRIQKDMLELIKNTDFNGDLKEFFKYIKTDSKFKYSNNEKGREDILKDCNEYINQTKPKLNELFLTLPKADLVVIPVEKYREKSVGGAFYENPSIDGKRPGRYYINLYNMDDEPKYQMESLTAHEALPGHHMQIAIAQELQNVPLYRKYSSNTAYIEGWALYAESLNKEIGFYQDVYSDFGRLSMEIFRAARLVVDVGIHYYKWDKATAVKYFQENTANADGDINKEIERYFLWPGQALGYKIGMLKIQELRDLSKKSLNEKFDIRQFHDVILKDGSVPLSILEKNVLNWIKEKQSN